MTCLKEKDPFEIRNHTFSLTGLLAGKPNNKITQIFEPIGPVIDERTVQDDPFTIFVNRYSLWENIV